MVHCPRTTLGKRRIDVMTNAIIIVEEKRVIAGCFEK
jgi:hypothetical protein